MEVKYTIGYVSLQLLVQNRRRKWHFPLNFRNGIDWTGTFSKAFSSSETCISVPSKNVRLYDNISNSFQSKTLYIVLIFKWSHLDTNLWICNLCICQKTCQQNFWTRFWHTENTTEGGSSIPLGIAKETISVLRNFCNHPKKGGQMSQKQSASPCTCILVIFMLKWEKKTNSHLEIILFIYIYVRKKNPKSYEMRWKRNLTFNNDDGKKTIQKLFTNYLNKKKLTTIPPPPAFSFSSSLSENRNKIIKKMSYPWIHYMVQNWCYLALQ